MIALKLVFQSLAGVGAVVGVAGGGYYAYSLPKDLFLLVSATVPTDNVPTLDLFSTPVVATNTEAGSQQTNVAPQNPSSTGTGVGTGTEGTGAQAGVPSTGTGSNTGAGSIATLTTAPSDVSKESLKEESKPKKQYKCKTTQPKQKEDLSCGIYFLSFNETNKSLSSKTIYEIIESTSPPTKVQNKNDLKTNNFFLLNVSSSLYESWSFDSTKSIDLLSTEDGNKSFASLKVHAKFEEKTTKGSTNFAIAKVTKIPETTAAAAADTTYKCSLKSKNGEDIKPCFFTKLSASNFEEENFSAINPSTTQAPITFVVGEHYLIKWNDDNKYKIEDLKEESVVIEELGVNTQPNKKTELEISAPVFLKPATAGTIEKIIFIKQ